MIIMIIIIIHLLRRMVATHTEKARCVKRRPTDTQKP